MSAMPKAKANTRKFTVKLRLRESGSAGSALAIIDTSQNVSGTETMAAAPNSTNVSVSSCEIRRLRPAPTARRVAISRRRVAARANSIPATLLQAMARRAPVNANRKPMNARNGVRTGPGIRPIAATAMVCDWLAFGCSFL
jgi:hypothetical protein